MRRVKMERFGKALDSQLEQKKNGLEMDRKAHVKDSYNKHIGSMRNGKSSFVLGSGEAKFEQK